MSLSTHCPQLDRKIFVAALTFALTIAAALVAAILRGGESPSTKQLSSSLRRWLLYSPSASTVLTLLP